MSSHPLAQQETNQPDQSETASPKEIFYPPVKCYVQTDSYLKTRLPFTQLIKRRREHWRHQIALAGASYLEQYELDRKIQASATEKLFGAFRSNSNSSQSGGSQSTAASSLPNQFSTPESPRSTSTTDSTSLNRPSSPSSSFTQDSSLSSPSNSSDPPKLTIEVALMHLLWSRRYGKNQTKIKNALRESVPDVLRSRVWVALVGADFKIQDSPLLYRDILEQHFGVNLAIAPSQPPPNSSPNTLSGQPGQEDYDSGSIAMLSYNQTSESSSLSSATLVDPNPIPSSSKQDDSSSETPQASNNESTQTSSESLSTLSPILSDGIAKRVDSPPSQTNHISTETPESPPVSSTSQTSDTSTEDANLQDANLATHLVAPEVEEQDLEASDFHIIQNSKNEDGPIPIAVQGNWRTFSETKKSQPVPTWRTRTATFFSQLTGTTSGGPLLSPRSKPKPTSKTPPPPSSLTKSSSNSPIQSPKTPPMNSTIKKKPNIVAFNFSQISKHQFPNPDNKKYPFLFSTSKLLLVNGISGIPRFGGDFAPRAHLLSTSGIEAAARVLLAVRFNFPSVTYCPSIPHIVQFALLFCDERESFNIICCILEKSFESDFYLFTDSNGHQAFVQSFVLLVRERLPKLYQHFDSIEIDLEALAHVWFTHFFLSILPFQVSLRIFDCFLSEGNKVLLRMGLGILKFMTPKLLELNTEDQVLSEFRNFSFTCLEDDVIEICFKMAFNSFRGLSRKRVSQFHAFHRESDNQRSISSIQKAVNSRKHFHPLPDDQSHPHGHSFSFHNLHFKHKNVTPKKSSYIKKKPVLPESIPVTGLKRSYSMSMDQLKAMGLVPNLVVPECFDYNEVPGTDIQYIPRYSRPLWLKENVELKHLASFEELVCLWRWLPDRYFNLNPQTVFHTHIHGYSLISLYQAIANNGNTKKKATTMAGKKLEHLGTHGVDSKLARKYAPKDPQIMLIKSTKNQVFGVYLSQPFEYTREKYVGTGESFLFTLRPIAKRYAWVRGSSASFYSGMYDSLDFGGNGLHLDANLSTGLTKRTTTFSNECLTDPTKDSEMFDVLDVEVLKLILT